MSINGYGWLPRNPYRWKGVDAGPSGVLVYDYGWPAGGASESNVAAQWLFDEGSGNIVDEVGAVSLAATGSPTYSYNTSAYSSDMAVGINVGAINTFFGKAADTALDLDQNDAVMEWVGKMDSTGTPTLLYPFDMTLSADSSRGYLVFYYPGLNYFRISLKADDDTSHAVDFTVLSAEVVDDKFHKYRMVFDRSSNVEFFIDGVSKGTGSLGPLIGKDVKCHNVKVFTREGAGSYYWKGALTELRFTVGNTTNNSGGKGGG